MRSTISFVLILMICSCVRNNVPSQIVSSIKPKMIRIVSKPDSTIKKVSEIASDIEYIPLQSSKDIRVKGIDKIILRGGKTYINSIDDILCFDEYGHFLYKLYNFEKIKKDSITTVYDFDIDSGDTTMIVLAYNKIMHFKNTGSGFDYVKSIKLKRILPLKMDFVPGTNKILLSTILNRRIFGPALYVIVDKEGDTLNINMTDFKRFNPEEHEIFNEILNYNFDNRIYLKEQFNDTVISIDTDSLIFNNDFILDSRLSGTNSENINDPEHFKMLPKIESILEVSRYLYFSYSFNHSNYEVFYDKNEDKRYEVDPKVNGLKDDIAGGPNFIPKYCIEGKMYSWISARALKKYSESEDFIKAQVQNTQKQEDIKKLVSSLKESDNPILILLRLKD